MHQVSFRVDHLYAGWEGISLPVVLTSFGTTVGFRASIDTGASFCIFQRKRAEELGLELESGIRTRIATVTGTFEAYGHEVNISVLEIEFETTVYFAADSFMPRDVLGRTGWLDRIRLGLVDHDQLVYLSHYND